MIATLCVHVGAREQRSGRRDRVQEELVGLNPLSKVSEEKDEEKEVDFLVMLVQH